MPFTLAHPAAVWPLKYLRWFAVIPLVIGSMTPDLTNYVLGVRSQINTHSIRGTLVFDLPFGYCLLLLLVLLRTPLVAPLWEPHRSFVRAAFAQFVATKFWWLMAIPSLVIGSWTHILWDSFTHENHFMVRKLPLLQHELAPDFEHPMQIYRVLQYGCSVLGMVIITLWYVRELRISRHIGAEPSWRKYLLVVLVVVSLLAGGVNAFYIPAEWLSVYRAISIVLTTAMPVFAGLYLSSGIVISRFMPTTHPPAV